MSDYSFGGGDFGGGISGGDYGADVGTVGGFGGGVTGGGATPGGDYGGGAAPDYSLDFSQNYGQPASQDYSLQSPQFQMAQLGQANYGLQPSGYEGLQARTSVAPGYGLTAPSAQVGLEGSQAERGFWDRPEGKVARGVIGMVPGYGGLINAGISAMQGQNPIGSLLGMIGGPVGMGLSAAYGAMNSKDPAGFLGQRAAGTIAGMAGNAIGGPAVGNLAGQAMGNLVGSQMGQSGNTSAFSTGSMLGPIARGEASGEGGYPGSSIQTAGGGGGTDWGKTIMGLGSGLMGLYNANQQRQTAQQAIQGSAPWQTGGGAAGAGQQLSSVISGDFSKDAGFKAAQQAAARASSQQPGGMAASAAAQAALKYQNERIQTLGAPAGVGFNPAQGYQTALAGQSQANELQGQALGSLGYGLTGSNAGTGSQQMPAWFQQYLINNKMGG